MRKINGQNERLKRDYVEYLKEAKGQDQKSVDKALAALVRFEESTKFAPFKKFQREQARDFKDMLSTTLNPKTKKPLSLTTIDATLRLVKGFFFWLVRRRGFERVLSYADVEYFNNNRKDTRAAHAKREVPFPSMKMTDHAFQAMPEITEIQKRDKAVFAFLMLTGARDGAVASFRVKHINLIDGLVDQNGREVNTKNSKSFKTTFFPVSKAYLNCFTAWVTYLRDVRMFGPEDALFPKPERELIDGKFVFRKLGREPYSNADTIRKIVRTAFEDVQAPPYTPHSFRKTLMHLMVELDLNVEQQKAWSQNLGHENFVTSVSSYLPVSTVRQNELIKSICPRA